MLSQLADILGVSVGDLLKGERTDDAEANAVSSVNEVLNYAEKTVQKKYSTIKLVLSLGFTALMLIGIIACAIVDVAIRRSFASAQPSTTQKKYVSEKQILRIVAGLFRTLVVVFVLPNGKQHSRANLRKGEAHEDYGNHHRKATDNHQDQIGSLLQSIK